MEQPEPLRLTYVQLAVKLGITPDAARVVARRCGWARLAPNRPGAPLTILVPEEGLAAEQWRMEELADRPDTPDDAPIPDQAYEAEQRAVSAEQRADEANDRAMAALDLADRLGAQLADAVTRGDQAIDQLTQVRVRAALAETLAEQARTEVRELRRADEARKARGRLRRVWDAWRGQ